MTWKPWGRYLCVCVAVIVCVDGCGRVNTQASVRVVITEGDSKQAEMNADDEAKEETWEKYVV